MPFRPTSGVGSVALRRAMVYPEQKKTLWRRMGRRDPRQFELVPLLLLGLTTTWSSPTHPRCRTPYPPISMPAEWLTTGAARIRSSSSPAVVVPDVHLLSVIAAWISLVKDPKSLINLPDRAKADISEAKAETRLFIGRCLFLMKTLTVGLMAYSVYATIEVAGDARVAVAFYIILAAVLVCCAFMVWRSLSLVLSGQKTASVARGYLSIAPIVPNTTPVTRRLPFTVAPLYNPET